MFTLPNHLTSLPFFVGIHIASALVLFCVLRIKYLQEIYLFGSLHYECCSSLFLVMYLDFGLLYLSHCPRVGYFCQGLS